ncbi:MAG TPA: hypothetical protein VFE31_07165 [Opitutaceae bacterium]|jgi:hypothetical protein|nr:hypothetical protein [Opitutaceae bacterium]
MRSFLLVAAITLIGFVAGGAAGIWYERHLPMPLPPPPFQPLSEFRMGGRGGPEGGPRPHFDRQELIQRIESLRPQLEEFQKRMVQINAEFDRNLDTILNPAQRARHAEDMKRHHGPNPNDTRPLSDNDISWIFREQAGRTVVWDVVIPFRLDQLTKLYGLDDAQREVVRALLLERRREFLELVDASPPPTVALSRLAQMMQRLKQPPPPAPASAH